MQKILIFQCQMLKCLHRLAALGERSSDGNNDAEKSSTDAENVNFHNLLEDNEATDQKPFSNYDVLYFEDEVITVDDDNVISQASDFLQTSSFSQISPVHQSFSTFSQSQSSLLPSQYSTLPNEDDFQSGNSSCRQQSELFESQVNSQLHSTEDEFQSQLRGFSKNSLSISALQNPFATFSQLQEPSTSATLQFGDSSKNSSTISQPHIISTTSHQLQKQSLNRNLKRKVMPDKPNAFDAFPTAPKMRQYTRIQDIPKTQLTSKANKLPPIDRFAKEKCAKRQNEMSSINEAILRTSENFQEMSNAFTQFAKTKQLVLQKQLQKTDTPVPRGDALFNLCAND
ncbi:uncharacterized protein LOC122503639 [Leptopilina heterotoma]|uniref:uncharacterized protein LOC122503638 n=1 Tax=Leptopilina heterotoma TaxID=63436 RepID=UPI001CA7DB64|nr:uncharacterized protein LOC122503638 [Leptopilina heterotoma]XP_043470195.1 uncharacterized protein LOC122503638 [Leptopilina heterotoma]XP_043470196.1 uncharacterized protein LOC122503638 [Leptopilina heterotoma]XP_043470197.1 uncharacterized protein LOC122503639 [Leptopilina heterotoma]XP_043470198.1 uncharacterized protein LOC122503639 [Leptopilina heterotoma]XP_043470199.1 uncharacterized protein LOC122503639 [Leptopilina heterotoma]XP_043470200.1 uncharacterized protein LOC122503639 [